jgi:hypothetical protein
MTREQILARAKAASSDSDEVQVVGYTDAEMDRGNAAVDAIDKLKALRSLWKKEDGK